MAGTDTAFDRIKSLLGKMDRSIDDARQQRLQGKAQSDAGAQDHPESSDNHSASENPVIAPSPSETSAARVASSPTRPPSKYGRARPIRELSKGSNLPGHGSPNGTDGSTPGWKTA